MYVFAKDLQAGDVETSSNGDPYRIIVSVEKNDDGSIVLLVKNRGSAIEYEEKADPGEVYLLKDRQGDERALVYDMKMFDFRKMEFVDNTSDIAADLNADSIVQQNGCIEAHYNMYDRTMPEAAKESDLNIRFGFNTMYVILAQEYPTNFRKEKQ